MTSFESEGPHSCPVRPRTRTQKKTDCPCPAFSPSWFSMREDEEGLCLFGCALGRAELPKQEVNHCQEVRKGLKQEGLAIKPYADNTVFSAITHTHSYGWKTTLMTWSTLLRTVLSVFRLNGATQTITMLPHTFRNPQQFDYEQNSYFLKFLAQTMPIWQTQWAQGLAFYCLLLMCLCVIQRCYCMSDKLVFFSLWLPLSLCNSATTTVGKPTPTPMCLQSKKLLWRISINLDKTPK